MSMNDYYRPEAVYPRFEVTYQVGNEHKVSIVTAKGVDFAKRLVYIKEGSLGNTGKVNIIRVVAL